MSEYQLPQVLGRQGPNQISRALSSDDPAAGAQAVLSVPGGRIWHVRGIRQQLVTDATVANRRYGYAVEIDGTEIYREYAAAVQAAGLTITYQFHTGIGYQEAAAVLNFLRAGFPGFTLFPGSAIRSVVDTFQAGDNLGPIWASVWEYELRGRSAAIAYELSQMLAEQLDLEAVTEAMLRRA